MNTPRETLWSRWSALADEAGDAESVVHWDALAGVRRWTRGELAAAARQEAARLADAGVGVGDVCGIILRHHPRFSPLYMGVCALGAVPSVLAYPNPRLHPEKFTDGLRGMAAHSGLDWILTERDLESRIAPLVISEGGRIRGLLFPLDDDLPASRPGVPSVPEIDPASTCLLQHSSGTTGLQKAVALSHRSVLRHVDLYSAAIALAPSDRIVSWLPLYHDMGLIAAFHLPLATGIPVVQIDPFQWISAPALLFEVMTEERGTLAWLPNFAYNLMADRIHEEDLAAMDLSRVRLLVNCSEPIRAESHDRFARRFASAGFRRSSLGASYAMAETTFAVSQSAPGIEPRRMVVDREALASGLVRPAEPGAPARECTSSGRPIEGCELRIVDEAGSDVPTGTVGEILIRSASLFDGYRNEPVRTAEVLRDGWYASGDFGFLDDGELYVIGRKKDLIIVAGKNLYPEDIEDAVGRVEGVLAGRVVAFSVDDAEAGTERVAVVAETQAETPEDRERLTRRIVDAVWAIDVTLGEVHLVPPRWLIKSSSGKPSRKANRERILAGAADRKETS